MRPRGPASFTGEGKTSIRVGWPIVIGSSTGSSAAQSREQHTDAAAQTTNSSTFSKGRILRRFSFLGCGWIVARNDVQPNFSRQHTSSLACHFSVGKIAQRVLPFGQ